MQKEIDYEKLAEAIAVHNQQMQQEAKNNIEWKDRLERDEKHRITNSIDNYIMFLNECPDYKDKLKYNEFLCLREYNGNEFTDFTLNNIYVKCEQEIGLSTHAKIDTALSHVFDNNRYNPVVEYLHSLKWDGKERIGKLFIDLLDVDDTLLNYQLTKKWFIAAVKRVFEPGCKFDNILVLQGSQGIGKSSICEIISKSFFNTISLSEIGNKDLIDKLNKTWIAIIDELDTFNKKEMSTIKTFLSLNSDSTRLSYARNTQTFNRHCVFIGSTNDETFLRDSTSSVERRFWVLRCNKTTMDGKIRKTLTEDFVNQLWAEAVHYYCEDPKQYLDIEANLQDDFAATQKEFKTYTDDIAIDYIKDILSRKYNLNNSSFKDIDDFYSQYSGSSMYDSNFMSEPITKIPMSWLVYVLKKHYGLERQSKYIALALSDEWEYKPIKYCDKTHKGLYNKQLNRISTLFDVE